MENLLSRLKNVSTTIRGENWQRQPIQEIRKGVGLTWTALGKLGNAFKTNTPTRFKGILPMLIFILGQTFTKKVANMLHVAQNL